MRYNSMTPAALIQWLAIGQESPILTTPDGDQISVARDADGWLVRVCMESAEGRRVVHEQRYQDEHEAFGALSALGPWTDDSDREPSEPDYMAPSTDERQEQLWNLSRGPR